jgi:hypothetical protein
MLLWSVGTMVVQGAATVLHGQSSATSREAEKESGGALVVLRDFLKSLWNPPFVSTLLGMAIGLNPWLVRAGQTHLSVAWELYSGGGQRGSAVCLGDPCE